MSGEVGPQEDMAVSSPTHPIHSVLPLRFVIVIVDNILIAIVMIMKRCKIQNVVQQLQQNC